MKKISATYWNQLHPYEQRYISERCDKDGIQFCKLVVNQARKQLTGVTRLTGYGIAETSSGVFIFSGTDTKKFKQVSN